MSLSTVVIYVNFSEEIKKNARAKLELHIYNILSVSEFSEQGINLPDILFHPRFNTVDSGLWALVLDDKKSVIWQSLSIENTPQSLDLPEIPGQWLAGETRFEQDNYLTMSYMVQWLKDSGNENYAEENYFVIIGEKASIFRKELKRFSFWLSLAIGGTATLLLIGQFGVLKRAFRPIDKMEREINELEQGKRTALSTTYPAELRGVERNINALIKKEHRQRERYREGMANLAHSLKTPMTIISSELNAYPENTTLKNAIASANNSIEYQLRRAVISGHTLLSKSVNISDMVSLVHEALLRIYQDKPITFETKIDDTAVFLGDENDLMEVLGNLLDNAYKHATKKIVVSASVHDSSVDLVVEDDGPGLDAEDLSRVFRRGERLDQQGFGQGIGLAVVHDIVLSYNGKISASRSTLGGACFTLHFTNKE